MKTISPDLISPLLTGRRQNSNHWQALWTSHPDLCFILDRNGSELQHNHSTGLLLELTGQSRYATLAGLLQQAGKNDADNQHFKPRPTAANNDLG
jgi:hypothetical protein